jgi:hypothetical protein
MSHPERTGHFHVLQMVTKKKSPQFDGRELFWHICEYKVYCVTLNFDTEGQPPSDTHNGAGAQNQKTGHL